MTDKKPIIMTLMVRDEADLVAAMIEHHLGQGVDLIIATDNASTDGTREILAQYAELGVVELHDDPRLEKQQAEVVTSMARRAFVEHGATWVINADADEFWFARSGKTLAEALSAVPDNIQSFNVPVRNLLGAPLESGSALPTHIWRDERTREALEAVGLHAHPTSDCVHRGSAHVTIQQGNHGSSLPLSSDVDPTFALEVLHVPFRQWSRYQNRVRNTASAYERSGLTPSPRHHGMRDARWLDEGALRPMFVARHPVPEGSEGFIRDTRVVDSLRQLLETGQARIPDLVAAALIPGKPLEDIAADMARFADVGRWMVREASTRADLEYRTAEFYEQLAENEQLHAQHEQLKLDAAENDANHAQEIAALHEQLQATKATVESLTEYVERLLSSRLVRVAACAAVPRYGWLQRVQRLRTVASRLLRRFKSRVSGTK